MYDLFIMGGLGKKKPMKIVCTMAKNKHKLLFDSFKKKRLHIINHYY